MRFGGCGTAAVLAALYMPIGAAQAFDDARYPPLTGQWLRAEVPGQFHALPVTGYAMYVPEIRCNGAEVRIKVEDLKRAD